MAEKSIRVAIINDPGRAECDASCGTDWSSPDIRELAREQIKERFGDNVRFTYTDVAREKNDNEAQEWSETINRDKLPVPLLLLNGNIRITGNFDIRQIMDAIEVESEIGV